jgi:sugar lactone lactonase YvrE
MSLRKAPPLLVLALAVGLPAQPALSSTPARTAKLGEVRFVWNGLGVRPPGRQEGQGKRKDPVFARFLLRTRAKQKASVGFRDGTVLKLNQRTDAVLHDPRVTIVKRGEVDQIDIHPGGKHRVQTASAVASAIGTNFDVRVKGRKSQFIVASGKVIVRNGRGKVTVRSDQQTTVLPGRPPGKPTHVDAQAAIRWTQPLAGGDWITLAGNPSFGTPQRVATDASGNVYVSDTHNSRIVKFSSGGKILTTWPVVNHPGGQPVSPMGVALDDQGNVYVADAGYSYIQKFSSSGQYLTEFGNVNPRFAAPGDFDGPEGVAVDKAGNIYVADSAFCRVQKLSSTGAPLAVWGDEGCVAKPGHFMQVSAVALDGTGNLLVTDPNNNQVVKISTQDGHVLATWGGTKGGKPGQFYGPNDVAVDVHGNVYVADPGNYRLQKLSPTGKPLYAWGNVLTNSSDTFLNAYGVAADTQDNLFVVDTTYLRKLPGGAR